ncbi:MAG: Transcriptional regulator, TetR family protein [Myxococcaceae bacterium]|nr:Transcriptional regulator, TetR family protein [Myxococcaceae bacterium]
MRDLSPRTARVEPLKRQQQPERSTERTKQRLVEAAKRAFARHGYYGATVQQIASDAGVNVSLISHHFGGKEALYRACLSRFGAARSAALDRYLTPPKSVAEFKVKLELLVHELLEQHLAEPEILAMLLRDVNDPDLWGKELDEQLFAFAPKLAQIFANAKARGFLRADADPLVAASMLYLTFSGVIQMGGHIERVSGMTLSEPATRRSLVEQALDLVLHGVLA